MKDLKTNRTFQYFGCILYKYSSREAFLFSVLAEILDERNCVSEFLYVVDPSLNDHNLIKSKWCLSFRLLVSSNWDVN